MYKIGNIGFFAKLRGSISPFEAYSILIEDIKLIENAVIGGFPSYPQFDIFSCICVSFYAMIIEYQEMVH